MTQLPDIGTLCLYSYNNQMPLPALIASNMSGGEPMLAFLSLEGGLQVVDFTKVTKSEQEEEGFPLYSGGYASPIKGGHSSYAHYMQQLNDVRQEFIERGHPLPDTTIESLFNPHFIRTYQLRTWNNKAEWTSVTIGLEGNEDIYAPKEFWYICSDPFIRGTIPGTSKIGDLQKEVFSYDPDN